MPLVTIALKHYLSIFVLFMKYVNPERVIPEYYLIAVPIHETYIDLPFDNHSACPLLERALS